MNIFTIDLEGTPSSIINGVKEGVWVERYRKGGEFTFKFNDLNLLDNFPLDSLVTHDLTTEIMVVENWQIDEERGKKPDITVSGSSLDAYLMNNRIVTVNDPGEDNIGGISDSVGGDYLYDEVAIPGKGYVANDCVGSWKLALEMLQSYLVDGVESATYEPIDNLIVESDYDFEESDPDKQYDYNFDSLPTLYDTVQQLLEEQDLGIKVRRPTETNDEIIMTIYKGRGDKDEESPADSLLYLSWLRGDISKAKYLWSTRSDKSALFIYDGDKVAKIFNNPDGNDGLCTRIGTLDVSELGIDWDVEPYSEAELEARGSKMRKKGRAYLNRKKPTEILDVNISGFTPLRYNTDYLMGDLIKIYGNYKLKTLMRVVEHVRSFDKNGERDYPVLDFPLA